MPTEDTMTKAGFLALPATLPRAVKYLPVRLADEDTPRDDALRVACGDVLHTFGLLSSRMFTLWARHALEGRKEKDASSLRAAYDTFPWPVAWEVDREVVSRYALFILEARKRHPAMSLEEMYTHDHMPVDLMKVHKYLDRFVDSLYCLDGFDDDEERVRALLARRDRMTERGLEKL